MMKIIAFSAFAAFAAKLTLVVISLALPSIAYHISTHDGNLIRSPAVVEISADNRCDVGDSLPILGAERRTFVRNVGGAFALLLLLPDQPANAAKGEWSKQAFPNYIDFLIDSNNKGLYDESKLLYRGADVSVQLRRISEASVILGKIPDIVAQKKWSQVNGALTGPLGTLLETMRRIIPPPGEPGEKAAKEANLKFKNDIIRVGQAATKKNEKDCIDAVAQASRDLDAFLEILF